MSTDLLRARVRAVLSRLVRAVGGGLRRNAVSAVKAALAAAVAWLAVRQLVPSGPGFYAPLVAALSVHPTVAKTLRDAGQRLLGVGIGLLLGYTALRLVDVQWWSLLLVTAVAVLATRWRRLGEEGTQVPIAALLMLLLAAQPAQYAGHLLVEGVVGAVTAAVVNLVVVPPVHVRSAGRALTELRLAVGDVIDEMSKDVGGQQWPPPSADWVERARGLRRPLDAAREAVDQGSESVRLNPRARRVRTVPQRQHDALRALEYIVLDVHQVARTLAEAADPESPSFLLSDAFRPRFAEALHLVAGALSAYGDEHATPDAAAAGQPLEAAHSQVADLRRGVAEARSSDPASLLAESALLTDLEQVLSSLARGPLHAVAADGPGAAGRAATSGVSRAGGGETRGHEQALVPQRDHLRAAGRDLPRRERRRRR